AIATDLRSLNRRLIDLETKLGRAQSTADIESRLASIRSRLDPAFSLRGDCQTDQRTRQS
ncbi:MAG: hypothetical protein AAFQ61_12650, partial [Cyanobacteria bacterium J06626_23]